MKLSKNRNTISSLLTLSIFWEITKDYGELIVDILALAIFHI